MKPLSCPHLLGPPAAPPTKYPLGQSRRVAHRHRFWRRRSASVFSVLLYSEECRNVDVYGGKKCVGELRDELDKCVGCIAHACCSTEHTYTAHTAHAAHITTPSTGTGSHLVPLEYHVAPPHGPEVLTALHEEGLQVGIIRVPVHRASVNIRPAPISQLPTHRSIICSTKLSRNARHLINRGFEGGILPLSTCATLKIKIIFNSPREKERRSRASGARV
jgi:hypothetical protein